ncbi:hypothetical protein I4F81_012501 [Pyropia yezoensis]|uniref:Uncharacterized protein n=1 Tax=Pyropia yezoensis TaxID=2788 RepID=A0ACC3CIU5_PYRYE|nr:hypothetical protein I4F81_012501 [Neopyropia yezoensis]
MARMPCRLLLAASVAAVAATAAAALPRAASPAACALADAVVRPLWAHFRFGGLDAPVAALKAVPTVGAILDALDGAAAKGLADIAAARRGGDFRAWWAAFQAGDYDAAIAKAKASPCEDALPAAAVTRAALYGAAAGAPPAVPSPSVVAAAAAEDPIVVAAEVMNLALCRYFQAGAFDHTLVVAKATSAAAALEFAAASAAAVAEGVADARAARGGRQVWARFRAGKLDARIERAKAAPGPGRCPVTGPAAIFKAAASAA